MTTAHEILQAAQKHMQDRARTYDQPGGERSMSATVEAFSAITGVTLTEEQGWLFMAVLKAVRSQQGDYRADSYEDGAAYFALAGEAAYVDRMPSNGVREAILDAFNKSVEDDDVWTKWNGQQKDGPFYGHSNVNVVVRLSDGRQLGPENAIKFTWAHNDSELMRGGNIIAYRIVK